MKNTKDKIKVLALMDSPTVATGFAQVSKNVLRKLQDTGKYDITVVGINHHGEWYDQEKQPFKIYPAMPYGYTDMYGRGFTFQALQGKNRWIKPPFDLLFTIQDHFILAGTDDMARGFNFAKSIKQLQYAILTNEKVGMENLFNWIGYFPVDGNLREYWVKEGIAMADYPVSYTVYGAGEMLQYDSKEIKLRERLSIIPHGVNTKDFYPLSKKEIKKFRDSYFDGKVKDDTFLIVNVSRNQIRKDMPRTIRAFAEYKKINPKAFLYLHCKASDQGGDIWEIARQLGIKEGTDMALPDDKFTANKGFPLEIVNKIYNSADVLLTTTLGEGWGFINTEAMAVKKPVIAPANTAIPEIFGMPDIYEKNVGIDYLEENYSKLRGVPVKSGYGLNDFVNHGMVDNGVIRPTVDIKDTVDKLDWVYKNKDKAQKIVDNAWEWIQTKTWEEVCKQWEVLFDKAYADLQISRETGHVKEEPKRNDPCHCGSGKKYKKCHGKVDKV